MKFNIYFTLKGPNGTLETPNKSNPVQAESISSLLKLISNNPPDNPILELTIVGLRIEEHKD